MGCGWEIVAIAVPDHIVTPVFNLVQAGVACRNAEVPPDREADDEEKDVSVVRNNHDSLGRLRGGSLRTLVCK